MNIKTYIRVYWKKLENLFLLDRRWIWSLFFVYLVGLFTFAVLGDRGLVQSYRLWQKKSQLQKQLEVFQMESNALGQQLEAYQSSERMIEKVAREQYNMSAPNELVFIFKSPKSE